MEESKVLTVSLLTSYIKSLFDREPFFQNIVVEGEISNYKRNTSGHLYFTLKDENAQISCVMFKSQTYSLTFEPKDGSKVYVKGSISLYPKSGVYQIYATSMKEVGLGDLYQKYEELKKKLELKGYFNKDRKRPLPKFPKCIALLTSKTGAVIEDLKSIILKRSQFSNLVLYPTKVQGEDAKYNIVENIKKANEDSDVDVIILARGGGSIEDLWPFNEEIVADAIYNSKKPIISAVGHETDFTISDFTADLRAATPSDAALIVVRDNIDLKNELDSLTHRLNISYKNEIDYLKSKVDRITELPIFKNKERLLLDFKQNLITLTEKLELLSPLSLLNKSKERLDNTIKHMNNAYDSIINNDFKNYHILNEKLNLLNPLSILSKGYSVTYKENNIIKSINDVSVGDTISTRVNDGYIESKVINKEKQNG